MASDSQAEGGVMRLLPTPAAEPGCLPERCARGCGGR
jgi:hypothetical protein